MVVDHRSLREGFQSNRLIAFSPRGIGSFPALRGVPLMPALSLARGARARDGLGSTSMSYRCERTGSLCRCVLLLVSILILSVQVFVPAGSSVLCVTKLRWGGFRSVAPSQRVFFTQESQWRAPFRPIASFPIHTPQSITHTLTHVMAPIPADVTHQAMRLYRHDTPRSKQAALRLFKQASDAGDANAQHALGFVLLHGTAGVRDVPAALRYFALAAMQGHISAAAQLDALTAMGHPQQHAPLVTGPPELVASKL